MRLWPRRPVGTERRAARLVADHLGPRTLPAPLRAAIERAVADKLGVAPLPKLDAAMCAVIDLYAQTDDFDADSGPVTVVGVRWTGLAAR